MAVHPFGLCATKYCCFCCTLDSDVLCCIIAFLCIVINVFSGLTNFGIGHWALYLMSFSNFALHLLAGILLFLGGFYGNARLKLAYCWLTFVGIFTVVLAFVSYILLDKHRYIIWGNKCHGFKDVLGLIIVIFHAVWLLVFDLYSSMIVLGNICNEEHPCESHSDTHYP